MRSCLSRDSEVLRSTGVQQNSVGQMAASAKENNQEIRRRCVVGRSYSKMRPTQLVKDWTSVVRRHMKLDSQFCRIPNEL